MDVATATLQTSQWSALMTINSGQSAVESTETASTAVSSSSASTYNHIPIIGFAYDRDASRLILLFRDRLAARLSPRFRHKLRSVLSVDIEQREHIDRHSASGDHRRRRLGLGRTGFGTATTGQDTGTTAQSTVAPAVTVTTAAPVAATSTTSVSRGVNMVI